MIKFIKKLIDNVSKFNDSVLSYRTIARDMVIPSRAFVNWGIYLANSGEVDLALEKFESSSYMRPQTPETFNNWGIALATMGKYDEAIEKFKDAIKIDSKCVKSYVLWGAALVETGKMEEAEKKYERALEFNSKNAEIFVNWGIALARQEMRQLAETKFKKAVSLSPRAHQAYFLWGVVLVEMERHAEAIEKLDFSLKLNPNNPDAWHYYSISLLKTKKLEEAYDKAKLAVDMIPSKLEFQLNMAEVLTEMKKYDKAVEYYKIAEKVAPDSAQLYLCWGITLQKCGEHFDAISKFNKSLEIFPMQTQAEYYLAVSLAETGEMDEAEKMFLTVVEKDKRYIDAYLKLATIADIKGDIRLAIERYKEVTRFNLAKTEANYLIASSYVRLGEPGNALEYYEKAVKDEPEHIDAWAGYAIALNETDNYEEAIRKIRRAYRLAPDSAHINLVYGIVLYREEKNLKDAIEKFNNAIKICPDMYTAHIAKGESLLRLKRLEEALNVFNEVFFKEPKIAENLLLLGSTYIELAERDNNEIYYRQAVEFINKALEINSSYITCYTQLAYIKAKQGDFESFENEFKRLAHEYPEQEELIRLFLNECLEKLDYDKSLNDILNYTASNK